MFVVSEIDFFSGERTRGGLKGRWIGGGAFGMGRVAEWGGVGGFDTGIWWGEDCDGESSGLGGLRDGASRLAA